MSREGRMFVITVIVGASGLGLWLWRGADVGSRDTTDVEPVATVTSAAQPRGTNNPTAPSDTPRSSGAERLREAARAGIDSARAPERAAEPLDLDPEEERLDTIDEMNTDLAGLRSELARILLSDADPKFRSAAAEKLAEADTDDARAALVLALSDTSPEVLLAVLDALEDIHDATAIQFIEPLLDHPNPDVAQAAEGAIGFLE